MFPDPALRWRPFPSIIDGIARPPSVLDLGLWRGVLHLIVLEADPGIRAFGIEIECEAYSAFDEMIYSIANHGDKSGVYDGSVYLKEAERSQTLNAFKAIHPLTHKHRQFLFVGGDYCFETIGPSEPQVRTFGSKNDAYTWKPTSMSES